MRVTQVVLRGVASWLLMLNDTGYVCIVEMQITM